MSISSKQKTNYTQERMKIHKASKKTRLWPLQFLKVFLTPNSFLEIQRGTSKT